jgi:hypothetical protein
MTSDAVIPPRYLGPLSFVPEAKKVFKKQRTSSILPCILLEIQ